MKYGVGPDKVHVEAKPEDCDYYYAHVGNKGCHYERRVTTYNAQGIQVDSAWLAYPHQKVDAVYVQWVQVKGSDW